MVSGVISVYSCFIITWIVYTATAQSGANSSEDPDFPDISPWVQKWFIDGTNSANGERDEKVMKPQPTTTTIYANTKLIVNNKRPIDQLPQQSNARPSSPSKEVSETDMYLLNAIEKLAFRLDGMEKRLRRTEELLVHVMEGSNVNKRQDACPANFTRVARNCYHFSERQFNWKSAASMCKSLGAGLVEIESRDEYMEVVTYIQASNQLRGYGFWTGGLNPGLLWIWANSARPVLPKKPSNRPEESVQGNGRCLMLSIDNSQLYRYHGTDCAARLRYICEHEENATIRVLKALQTDIDNKKLSTV